MIEGKSSEGWAAFLKMIAARTEKNLEATRRWFSEEGLRETETLIVAMRIGADAIRQVGPFAPVESGKENES